MMPIFCFQSTKILCSGSRYVIMPSSDEYCRLHICSLDWLHNRYARLYINPPCFSHLPFCTTRAVLLDSFIQFDAVNLSIYNPRGWVGMASQVHINSLNPSLNFKPRFENLKPKFKNYA